MLTARSILHRIVPSLVTAEAPVPMGRPLGSRPRPTGHAGGWMGGAATGQAGLGSLHESGLLFQIMATRARRLRPDLFELVRVDDPDRYHSNRELADADRYERPHIADRVWRDVNPNMTLTELLQLWSMYWDMIGEMFILPTFNGSIPVELWPANPTRMTPVPHPERYLDAWLFRSPASGVEHRLDPSDVWFDRFPDPSNDYRGMGAITGSSADLASAKQAAEWQANLLKNRAGAELVLTTAESLTDKEYDRLLKEIERHTGPRNAGRAWLMEKGVANMTSFSPREMQFTEGREGVNAELRQAWGISKTLLGASEDVNRATAQTAQALEAESHTIPKLDRVAYFLNRQFLPRFGPVRGPVQYRYVDPTPNMPDEDATDRDSRVGLFNALVGHGADPAEAAAAAGLPEVVWEPRSPAPPPPPAPALDDDPDDDDDGGGTSALLRVLAQEIPEDMQRVEDDYQAALAALISKFGAIHSAWLTWTLAELKLLLGDNKPIGGLQLPGGEITPMTKLVAEAEQDLADTAAQRAADELNAELETDDAKPVSKIESIAKDAALIAAATFIGSLIGEAVRLREPGIPPGDITAEVEAFAQRHKNTAIKDQFKGLLTRAQNRARIGTIDLAVKAGLVVFEATEVLDGNTCGPCKRIDGVRFGSQQEALAAYPSGGYKRCDGRSRCRGTVRPVRKA